MKVTCPIVRRVGPPELVATGGGNGYDWMLAHGDDFYFGRWTPAQAPQVWSTYDLIAVTAAGTSTVATGDRRMSLFQFTDTLYWLEYENEGGFHRHRIRRLTAAGPETVVEGPEELTSYAVSRDYVYFHDRRPDPTQQTFQSRINRQALAGGAPEILDQQLGYTGGYAADAEDLYATSMGASSGDLIQVSPSAGGVTTLLASVQTTQHPLRVDGTWVSWSEEPADEPGSLIRRIPKLGGEPQTLAKTDVIVGLALDDTHVYFLSKNAIHRVDKTTGEVACVTKAPRDHGAEITVGAAHVYWWDGESIWRASK